MNQDIISLGEQVSSHELLKFLFGAIANKKLSRAVIQQLVNLPIVQGRLRLIPLNQSESDLVSTGKIIPAIRSMRARLVPTVTPRECLDSIHYHQSMNP